MNRDTHEMLSRLERAGITPADALALRRISMTLHRWHEMECGDERGRAIERDEKTGKPYVTYEGPRGYGRSRYAVPDREKGAHKRLASVMARYPDFVAYIQGDPRGASLYLVKKTDVPPGENIDAYYTRGIAVYR